VKKLGVVTLFVPLALAGLASAAGAEETGREYCDRYIGRVPFTIRAPGHYCFRRDLATAAPIAIRILADDVTLDLNGYRLESSAGPGAVTNGVFADSQADVTVRNGTLRGFYGAVLLADAISPGNSRNHVVENLRVEDSGFYGIQVDGFQSTVRRCTVTNTGGSMVLENTAGNAFGILMFKGSSLAIDNSVLIFHPSASGSATGMRFSNGDFAVVGNRVSGGTISPTTGIEINSSEGGYRDNIVWRVNTAYVGGIDLGNNSSY
jgi:hypothetical protein